MQQNHPGKHQTTSSLHIQSPHVKKIEKQWSNLFGHTKVTSNSDKTGLSNIGSNLKRFVGIDAHVCLEILKPEQRSSIIFVKSFCPRRSCSLCSPMAWAAAHCWSSLPGLRSQNLTKHLTCLLYKFRKSTTKSKCVFLEITQSQIEFNESSRRVQTCCALLPRLVCLAGMSSLAILNPEVSKWSQDVALVARLSDQNHAWYILVQFLSSLKTRLLFLQVLLSQRVSPSSV